MLQLFNNKTKLIDVLFLSGTAEQNHLYERQPWQKLVSIFLAELFGTAFLMFFGCMGLVPKYPGDELGQYNGAIAFAGIVAVTIVVSIL
jgi:hypothetical protein